jgi:hypothetical protein
MWFKSTDFSENSDDGDKVGLLKASVDMKYLTRLLV